MSDIHAIIAAAKRWGGSAETAPDKARDTLRQHAIVMAEALARIATQSIASDRGPPWEYPSDIARVCLDKIVKEANRGDITAELAALPKMPDPKGTTVGNAFIIERYYALVPRLALAERLLGEFTGNGRRLSIVEFMDDARAYLAHRAKETT